MNDMLKRLLSFTLALVMVFGMMPAEALASELDNTEPTVTPTEAPTEVVTEAPATEHSHAHEGAVTTAATCEAEGVMTYTCSCGDTYTKEIAALGHTYVDCFCACGAEDPDGTPANDGNKGDDVPEEWEPRKWIFTLCFCEVCVFNSRNKDFMLISRGFPGGSARKESICNVGDLGLILDWEDPLEKRTPTHSSIQA